MDQQLIDAIYEARDRAYDRGRTAAVERVHANGRMTARERVDALLDPGSAAEYGILNGRADWGWVHTLGGVEFVGTVDGQPVVTSSTDYSDHGGGYGAGQLNRLLALAQQNHWPIVLFADGGGSRAQVLEGGRSSILSLKSRYGGGHGLFEGMAGMAGHVPSLAVVSGPSFAGHATLAACCDTVIATRGSSIGMGGPPMVEAAFGVRLKPTELGPVEMHEEVGGIDLLVNDERAAIAAVRRYLSYLKDEPPAPQPVAAETLRDIVPNEGAYDMHAVIAAVVDADSVFELRPNFAATLITAFARIDGRAIGIIANQPLSPLEGTIDQDAAGKIARFIQLCDSYDMPILSLADTPGFVVRSEAGVLQPGMTRHHARPIRAMHHRSVPLFSVQLRKARGLASAAMTGIGNAHALPMLRLAWPTVEMGRESRYSQGFDDVIDPAETRERIVRVLRLTKRPPMGTNPRRYRDSW